MQAYELTIEAKVKPAPFAIVSADDFHVQTGRSIDAHVVLEQPTLSLYCLDHANQRALFVDTPPEVDLLQAPFYFIAQYHMWVSTMQDSRWLQQQGAALACARFEDLKAAPQAVMQSLLAHCGLPMPDPDRLHGFWPRIPRQARWALRIGKRPCATRPTPSWLSWIAASTSLIPR